MSLRLMLILLAVGLAMAQDDGSAAAADEAGGEDGSGGEEECEESWEYIEFLRGMVNGKVEKILVGLREAKNQKGVAVLEDTVSNTVKQVLEVRESVLDRIYKLRKEEIAICVDQNIRQEENLGDIRMKIMTILLKLIEKDSASIEKLQEIKADLLMFRTEVSNEIMRVMLLPQGGGRRVPASSSGEGDCTECELLQTLSDKMENLISCAENDGLEGDADEEETSGLDDEGGAEEGAEEEGAEAGGECMPPTMYGMDLIDCTRKIDKETERLFPSLFQALDDSEREELETKLKNLKEIREEVDSIIKQLANAKGDVDKIKKIITRKLSSTASSLQTSLKECKATCGPDGCDSCGAEVLYDMLAKMENYLAIYNDTEGERDPLELNDEVRRDLMKYISSNSEDSTKILGKRIEGTMDECDQEKMDVFNKTKNPMWMLVNTTIFTEGIEEPTVMVETMVEMLRQLLQEYCAGEEIPKPRKTADEPTCEWDEYTQIGEYINKVDDIIQESLFKPKADSAKLDAQRGYIDIKTLFDKRVEKLFLDNMVCPNEALTIKKEWMPALNKCMIDFMNTKLKFTQMTRLERITCTKSLRTSMDARRSELLSQELEKSINEIGEEDGSGL